MSLLDHLKKLSRAVNFIWFWKMIAYRSTLCFIVKPLSEKDSQKLEITAAGSQCQRILISSSRCLSISFSLVSSAAELELLIWEYSLLPVGNSCWSLRPVLAPFLSKIIDCKKKKEERLPRCDKCSFRTVHLLKKLNISNVAVGSQKFSNT